jgi:hypothetical protein
VCRCIPILLTELWSNTSYRLSLYRLRTDPTENTACIVEEACSPLGCLAIKVLFLSGIVCRGDMFTGPLPNNGSIRHNIYNNWKYIYTKRSNIAHHTLQENHVLPIITWALCDRKEQRITVCSSILVGVHTWRRPVRPKHVVNEWAKIVFQ